MSKHSQIPISYYSARVGYALIDPSLNLDPAITWRLELPVQVRKLKYTPDVLLAVLREDKSLLAKCHPFITISGLSQTIIRLARLALRPQVIPSFNELVSLPRGSPRKEMLTYEVSHELNKISRVVFLNKNRIDCRKENLVEIEVDLPLDDMPQLLHDEEGS